MPRSRINFRLRQIMYLASLDSSVDSTKALMYNPATKHFFNKNKSNTSLIDSIRLTYS